MLDQRLWIKKCNLKTNCKKKEVSSRQIEEPKKTKSKHAGSSIFRQRLKIHLANSGHKRGTYLITFQRCINIINYFLELQMNIKNYGEDYASKVEEIPIQE